MAAASFPLIYDYVIHQLLPNLSKSLSYHSIDHTLDVLNQSERIANEEGIHDPAELSLLKTAALYHDTGFLFTYKGHEDEGCRIAREQLPGFNVTGSQIEKICGMIMATQLPQTPLTKMEEIICDADLDYLGRPDFFLIADVLYRELTEKELVHGLKQWNLMQVNFIRNHHYFTSSSKKLREPQKNKHCSILEAEINKLEV